GGQAQRVAVVVGEGFAAGDGQGLFDDPLRLTADSLCVHGDNPESLAVLRRLRAALDSL
ncbi:LamB/YcsF family protein, partial [Pseudomonas aeruginosa]|uniref:LamB/YcsF family protein n=1 Tax=Pseudomonas aeruginosa TaxID=287 RepID=UPI0024B6AB39